MRSYFVLCVLCVFGMLFYCGYQRQLSKAETEFANKNNYSNEIAKVLPAEYAKYRQQMTRQYDVDDCNSVFAIMSSAKALLKSPKSSTSKKIDYRKAYRATWRECLRLKQKSKDQSVQKLILKKWDEYLLVEDDDVPFQIYALSEPSWDRAFLSDNFWKLLQRTKKANTIAAISYVLYENGNAADMHRLILKQKSGIDIQLQGIIQNAINHMRHRLSGDRADPGPAALGPRIIFDDIPPEEEVEQPKLNKTTNQMMNEMVME